MKKEITVSLSDLETYRIYLQESGKGEETIKKYLHDVKAFILWLSGRELTGALCGKWKSELQKQGLADTTINARLAALNQFLESLDLAEFKIQSLSVQRRCFRDAKRDLSQQEYHRLVAAADRKGDLRLKLLLETICSTGIRVSELHYITAEALQDTSIRVSLKGKIREILLPTKLIRKLKAYARSQGILSGEIFLSKNGKPLSRQRIWAQMKALCLEARVNPKKVFPHNLRHLFARVFYTTTQDIVKLADVLGHSNLQTTRIYLISTGEEHRKQMDSLGLVS